MSISTNDRDFYRDAIIPMVAKYNYDNNTNVSPETCVKIDGIIVNHGSHPDFNNPTGKYTFAVAILEGIPVFVNDIIYATELGFKLRVIDIDTFKYSNLIFKNIDWSKLSWNPPPKQEEQLSTTTLDLTKDELKFLHRVCYYYPNRPDSLMCKILNARGIIPGDKIK